VDPEEVIFTSGGTESDNLAIKGVALAAPRGRHIITSAIEHEAVQQTCSYLERFHGFHITRLSVDHHGSVDLRALESALSPDVTLVSVQYANSEVGTIQDVSAIARLCRDAAVPFHTDAVQAAGVMPLDIDADLLSLSAHKFGGPKGVGALVKRSGVYLEPLMHGGGQEGGLRSGTGNVAGAVGLAAALHHAATNQTEQVVHLTGLRDRLISGILDASDNARLTGHPHNRLPHHASFCFAGVSGESVLLDLEARGIACSSGSACAAGNQEPSPVLLAMGYAADLAETAVRFTLGTENTESDIARVLEYFR
jgi:cysteine desulfurase